MRLLESFIVDYDLIPVGSVVYLMENVEAKRPHIIKRLEAAGIEDHDDVIDGLVQADPTARRSNGKKTPFVNVILSWVIAGTTIFPEDIEVTHDLLAKYEKLPAGSKKPIDQYKSFSDLYDDISDDEEERSYGDVAELVAEEGRFKMYRIDNWEQSEFCFKDSGWCVRYKENFDEYGPPYFMVTKGNKRYALLHEENNEAKDVTNTPLTLELAKPIKSMIEMVWPRGGYKNDLFKIAGFWPEQLERLKRDTWYAYEHAKEVIKGRWPEAEPYIMKKAGTAYDYALNVIKDRWPEAEPIIMKNAGVAYDYALHVIKGRWPKAEPYIIKNAEVAYYYAKDVIKGRWPEAEPYIMKNAMSAYNYARRVIKGRWPEAEPYIMKDKELSKFYAKEMATL